MNQPQRLALLLVSLALASCGGTPVNSSSVNSTSSLPSSTPASEGSTSSATLSSETSARDDTALKAFLTACKPNNGRTTSTIATDYGVADHYGEKAFYYESGSRAKTGYLVNGTQGIFDFSIVNDAVILGQALSAETSLYKATYTLADLAVSEVTAFTPAGANAYAIAVDSDNVSDLEAAIVSLAEVSTAYLSYGYITSISLSLTNTTATFSFDVNGTAISLSIYDLGAVSLPTIDTYLANPKTALTPAGFYSEVAAAQVSLFGQGNLAPFPKGVDPLFRQDVSMSEDDTPIVNGVSLTQFAQDISTSYIAQLTAEGYVSRLVSSLFGDTTYYEKKIVDQTETAGAHYISITCTYDSDYDETDIAIGLYIAPITYTSTDLTKANAYLTAYNTTALSIPLLTASDKITEVKSEDSASLNGTKLYLDVTVSIAAVADADAYVTAYDTLILAAGFTANSDYNLKNYSENGFFEYTKSTVTVYVSEAWTFASDSDQTGAYGGTLTFSFVDSAAA
jgi:hypothetical protein